MKIKYGNILILSLSLILIGLIVYYFAEKDSFVIYKRNSFINCQEDSRVYYEISVREFSDSNGDGIGDINGIINNLDYLENLGIGAINLLPIQESYSSHGYDIIDYKKIKKEYGTMEDFENLIKEANRRDIKVNISLVLNNTSDKHIWFEEAKNGNNKYRDYYIWKRSEDDVDKINHNIIAPSTKFAWRELNEHKHYYALLSPCMPDLNLSNEFVKNEIKDIAKFYIDKGVDGFKLESVKLYFNSYKENVEFIENLTSYCKGLRSDFTIIGDVREGESNMKGYLEILDGFLFLNLGDIIKEGLLEKNINNLSKVLSHYYYQLNKYSNNNFAIYPILNNKFEDRFINSLRVSEENMKMAATIYLTLPGNPIIYFGEELGVSGKGFVKSKNEASLIEFINYDKDKASKIYNNINENILLSNLEKNKSIYEFYKKLLKARNENISLKEGTVHYQNSGKESVMIMRRKMKDEISYVIINSNKNSVKVNLPAGEYKVTLSNKRESEIENIKKNLYIDGEEILILTK